MGKIRGTHSSPGIYTKITDIAYAAKTLGITTAGLVGETLQGPAFEPIMVKDFTEYQNIFGGTSAERFKGSLYPKYELPYIAKSYLSKSDQLYVCRVLGLSGYNAGPAYAITARKGVNGQQHVIAILRSRATYAETGGETCGKSVVYDTLQFTCKQVSIQPFNKLSLNSSCEGIGGEKETSETIDINAYDYGRFTIVTNNTNEYTVSLNPGDKDYIYKVLGGTPTDTTTDVFVEELYDLHLERLILDGEVDNICTEVIVFEEEILNPICDPVAGILTIPQDELKTRHIGKTYLATSTDFSAYTSTTDDTEISVELGKVYKVAKVADSKNIGATKIGYVPTVFVLENETPVEDDPTKITVPVVKVLSDDVFYRLNVGETETTVDPLLSFSDYREQFRSAVTPWFVSQATASLAEIQKDGEQQSNLMLNVNKLFRLHTITDGNSANAQFKVSISNILPEEGTFDLTIRSFYDSDAAPIILESFKNVSLKRGDDKFLGLKIGTIDGEYEIKSKYVMVEFNEDVELEGMVPCGFLGYPIRDYNKGLLAPTFVYNTTYDQNIRDKKQYFGLSDITGVDLDLLNYKGKSAYTYEYGEGFTKSFHLDSYMNPLGLEAAFGTGFTLVYKIDNKIAEGIEWDTVSPNEVTEESKSPIIGTESEMNGTIYENVKLRKFTCYPYGGFDGWDIYRTQRTTGDEFKANKYKGKITNGFGSTFSTISDNTMLNLEGRAITSDYYAFLAGAKQFEDPERYVINLFATPGIDYVNDKQLSVEILEMLEEKRMDSLYVMITPDKPKGASDSVDEMFTSEDVAANLEDSDIDTYYAATYYPWIKYFDKENNVYINLSPTKDALRNMADVDNKKYPWYAPAGIERGSVDCRKMHFFAKLEDEDTVYDGRINPLKTFSRDGVKIWGNKTMYTGDTPMNRINVVRLMLYMRKLIIESTRGLIFEPNDVTLKAEFESIVNPILSQIKKDRGITDFRLEVSQTPEQMDAHELSATLYVKPTPTLEYIEINFVVTPQGVSFDSI
jgi:hypothetical protein